MRSSASTSSSNSVSTPPKHNGNWLSHASPPSPTPRKSTPTGSGRSYLLPRDTNKHINKLPSSSTTTPGPTTRRSLLLTKPKSEKDPSSSFSSSPPTATARSHVKLIRDFNPIKPAPAGTQNGNVGIRPINRPFVEQHARPSPRQPPRPITPVDSSSSNNKKPDAHDLIASLQSEVLTLRAELEKAQSFNLNLQSLNQSLSQQLASAHARISSLNPTPPPHQSESVAEHHNPKFKDLQQLISNKLENPAVSIDHNTQTCFTSIQCSSATPSPPPPPPPPLPRRPVAKAVTAQKVSSVVELYQSLSSIRGNSYAPVRDNSKNTRSAHNSIVGEIQNRSTHLLAIKKDIETKGEFINGLIQKVLAAAYSDIEDVLSFVDWLDKELSILADEQAVLKHFKWPEKKADAMREAAIEYRNLKLLESEVSSYKDDLDLPYGVSLKKMARLLDKSERSLQRLIQLRSSNLVSYRGHKIPTDWMLDSGIVSKIKQASINLAKVYVKRVIVELESIRYSERESTHEALLLQGVHFAYRAHQFSGGLDSETLCAFEEIRRRVPGQLQGSSQVFAGITSS